jgi:hypothetical protein
MVSAITAEYCPPSAWNAVRDGVEHAVYLHLVDDEVVLLLVMVYVKADRENVKPKDIKRS